MRGPALSQTHSVVNARKHEIQVVVDLGVREADDAEAEPFEVLGPLFVVV